MWLEKNEKGRQQYGCRSCGRTKMLVFKEPMARKPRSSGSRVRITVQCPKCKNTPKRVGWLTHG